MNIHQKKVLIELLGLIANKKALNNTDRLDAKSLKEILENEKETL